MNGVARSTWVRWSLLALLSLLAAWLAAPGMRAGLAWHWNRQLDRTPVAEWPVKLRRLLALGEPGLYRVACRVGDHRQELAEEAGEALHEQLDAWQIDDPSLAAARMTLLASTLAEQVESWSPQARDIAASLARRMLNMRFEAEHGDTRDLLVSCERVLRHSVPLERAVARDVVVTDRTAPLVPSPAEVRPPLNYLVENVSPPLPGGGLPVLPPLDGPLDDPPVLAEESTPEASPAEGPRLEEPRRLVLEVGPVRRSQPEPNESTDSGEPDVVANKPAASSAGDVPETIRLVMLLHAGDGEQVSRAHLELRAQGFSSHQIEVVKRLFDPDPQVRQQSARALPGVRGMNAKPWLLWLTRDENADVRLVAIGLLATSRDPELTARMREIANDDADSRVRRQAERYLQGATRR